MRRVDGNLDDIQTRSDQEFVDHRGANRPHVVQRVGLVRPVEKLRRTIGVAVQRLVLEIRIVLPAEREPLPGRQVRIER